MANQILVRPSGDAAGRTRGLGVGTGRNRLRNGAFTINQRGVSSTVTLPAGAYGHDGWKAGSGGCTYTFAAAASGDVTLTISAGSLLQVVEGKALLREGGSYTLSWLGTATGRVYQGTATAYAAGPVTATDLIAGTNALVEFGTGTLSLVQFEPGGVATLYERRDDEMLRCQAHYFQIPSGQDFPSWGFAINANDVLILVALPVMMRAVPVVTAASFRSITALDPTFASRSFDQGAANIAASRQTLRAQLSSSSGAFAAGRQVLVQTAANGSVSISAEL